jgi:TM2 domain-containing membrane protein YozV
MRVHVKAALLSAFVLPGLGQLYKGNRVKGVVLILLVNVFLLAALYFVMQGMGELVVKSRVSGTADVAGILDTLQGRSPAARWLLAAFFALWAFAVADALFAKADARKEKGEGKKTGRP